MQTAWSKLQEAVRRRIGRDRIDAADDAARAEDDGYPLGRPERADDPDSDPPGGATDREG